LALLALVALDTVWTAQVKTFQAGWLAITEPGKVQGFRAYDNWREWLATLDGVEPLMVALPENRPLAAFYRQPKARPVRMIVPPPDNTMLAEEWLGRREGWSILPAARFVGREGRVMAKVLLEGGDAQSPFSLVAFRRLGPEEKPPLLIYGKKIEASGQAWIVREWSGSATLWLRNTGDSPLWYSVTSVKGNWRGELDAMTEGRIEIGLDANAAQEVRLEVSVAAYEARLLGR
jgi:hypothetical protein